MAELDSNIPLNYLSGAYTKNLWKDNPVSSVLETYLDARKKKQEYDEIERKKQAFRNVAGARKGVETKYNEAMFSKAETAQKSELDQLIIAKQAELDAIDAEIADLESQQNTLINETPVAGAMTDYTEGPGTEQGAGFATQGLPYSNIDRKDRSPYSPYVTNPKEGI